MGDENTLWHIQAGEEEMYLDNELVAPLFNLIFVRIFSIFQLSMISKLIIISLPSLTRDLIVFCSFTKFVGWLMLSKCIWK